MIFIFIFSSLQSTIEFKSNLNQIGSSQIILIKPILQSSMICDWTSCWYIKDLLCTISGWMQHHVPMEQFHTLESRLDLTSCKGSQAARAKLFPLAGLEPPFQKLLSSCSTFAMLSIKMSITWCCTWRSTARSWWVACGTRRPGRRHIKVTTSPPLNTQSCKIFYIEQIVENILHRYLGHFATLLIPPCLLKTEAKRLKLFLDFELCIHNFQEWGKTYEKAAIQAG